MAHPQIQGSSANDICTDGEGLNLPEPIHSDRERDLQETRTTKTVCDKAEAPQSERSEIKLEPTELEIMEMTVASEQAIRFSAMIDSTETPHDDSSASSPACVVASTGLYRVVECECGCGRVLFCPLLGKVLKEWREVSPPMVLGIMVMVFGVMSGMSSGERLMARV
ncbi:hypothetical protein INR49_018064 [Caranx melampygus]|nr:hypothetical protein INR49_018064 [Caranx melampygus]